MGMYERYVVPYWIELGCGLASLAPLRERAASKLAGTVLEIGFGSGLNVPFYPAAVERVLAVDPSDVARRIGRKRIARARCAIESVGLDAERIDLPDGAADVALSTFTLCTIDDAERALREVKRVLKPGGLLYFVEHGRAPERGVARWQDRLNGLQRAVCGGCNLNRDIPALLEAGGFRVASTQRGYLPGTPRTHGYVYEGVAAA